MIPKKVKNFIFLSIPYSKTLQEIRNPKSRIQDRFRISRTDLPFRKGYKPQFTQEIFEIVAISSKEPPTYMLKDELDEILYGAGQKQLIKVF